MWFVVVCCSVLCVACYVLRVRVVCCVLRIGCCCELLILLLIVVC